MLSWVKNIFTKKDKRTTDESMLAYGFLLASKYGELIEANDYRISKLPLKKEVLLGHLLTYLELIYKYRENVEFRNKLIKLFKNEPNDYLFSEKYINALENCIMLLGKFQNDSLANNADKIKDSLLKLSSDINNDMLIEYMDISYKECEIYLSKVAEVKNKYTK